MYEGVAKLLGNEFPQHSTLVSQASVKYKLSLTRGKAKGRVMIDSKTFTLSGPRYQIYLSSSRQKFRTEDGDHLGFQDNEFMICNYLIPGFSLVDKAWGFFNVDHIHEVDYDSTAFEVLMLDPEQKQMILSLVKTHTDSRLSFDDVIKSKGKGMIFLLHGEPGVGKTLTAGMPPGPRHRSSPVDRYARKYSRLVQKAIIYP